MNMKFASWLQSQLTQRGWDQSEIIKRAKMSGYPISHTQISRIVNGDRKAGPDACIAIAHGLGMSREDVFRARGWLTKPSDTLNQAVLAPSMAEVMRTLTGLPQDTQELVAYPLKAQLDTIIKALDRPAPPELTTELAELKAEFKRLLPDDYEKIKHRFQVVQEVD